MITFRGVEIPHILMLPWCMIHTLHTPELPSEGLVPVVLAGLPVEALRWEE